MLVQLTLVFVFKTIDDQKQSKHYIYTEEKGRCLVTNENMSQGKDILLVLKPYGIVSFIIKKHNVCTNSMKISDKIISCRQHYLHVYYSSKQGKQQYSNKFL